MKLRTKELREQGEALFTKRQPIMSLWQGTAEQFYVERADFTTTRSIGLEFAAHLMSGYPAMCRRDLANQIGAMLRPRGQPWFHPRTPRESINKDQNCKTWLDWAGEVMRLAMYDTHSGFVRSTREGDHDFATFGQAVIQVEPNKDLDGLLYRCWHLRDVAWQENAHLEVDRIHRKQKMQARNIVSIFGNKDGIDLHHTVRDAARDKPFTEFNVQHIIVPASDYDLQKSKNKRNLPYVSIYLDVDNETVLEEVPVKRTGYVIPRWQTIAGSQYAYSPASVIALSDARMLQNMTLTLLEAGQKSVDPPMLAVGEVLQGGVNTFAGGITYVEAEYDEKTGEALRPLPIDRGGFQWGEEKAKGVREMILQAFYLNQIQLPEISKDMTAYETQKRVEEYIRRALPLFEPMETEYNGAICDTTFDLLLDMGAFGNLAQDMPQQLRGQDVRFTFESPLQAAQTRANSQAFMQSAQILQIAAQLDPDALFVFDTKQATRDALEGAGDPATWILPPEVADQKAAMVKQAAAEQQQQQQAMEQASQVADTADKAGGAMQKIGAAMGMQQPDQQQGAA